MDIDDHERFTRCWTQAQSAIAGYVGAMVSDPHLADDVLQDVAVTLLRKFPDYDPSRPFIAWAMGVAKMQILTNRRDHHRASARLCDAAVDQLTAAWEELLPEADARTRALADCVERLDPRGRELVVLRYRESLDPQAIAERLRCSCGAVRTALSRLRSALHDCVSRRLAPMDGQ
jgi:RNA polymerase sigma-70 factor (ECF subfamily)